MRERAVQRAREMVSLAATVHGHLVVQQATMETITRALGSYSRAQVAALRLVARLPARGATEQPLIRHS